MLTEGSCSPSALSLLQKKGREQKGRPLSLLAQPAFSGENGTPFVVATTNKPYFVGVGRPKTGARFSLSFLYCAYMIFVI